MSLSAKKQDGRVRRKKGIRKKVFGTAERPRMSVFRSSKHIYVQVINDMTGETLAAASSLAVEVRSESELKKAETARKVGELAAQRCLAKNIDAVVFDRNGYIYTGRVAALADGARSSGLKF